MKKIFLAVFLVLLSAISVGAYGNSHVGILVKKKGSVEVFINPSLKPSGKGPHVLFQGKYYEVSTPKLGFKIENENVVRTGNNSQAKIVFKNGDQFLVGPGTSYLVTYEKKAGEKNTGSAINLMYGKFRAIVSKKGPRSGMEVKTKTASMGVRGTDFFVTQKGNAGQTGVSVLRGEVAVKPTVKSKKSEVINVQTGFSAEIVKDKKPSEQVLKVTTKEPVKSDIVFKKENVEVKLSKTTKTELVVIQKSSVIHLKKEEAQAQKDATSKKDVKEIETLEKKAVETTMSDIKSYDQTLYAKLQQTPVENVDEINSQVVAKIYKEAPKGPTKLSFDELGELDDDPYEKYFNLD